MSNPHPDDATQAMPEFPKQAPTVDETSAFTPTAGGMPAAAPTMDDPLLGTSIGRYRLLKKLGEGGMGSVYLAEQSEPVKRQVALKLIRGGVDSRKIIARFEAERQALAVMDHPNIARIYDGGTTGSETRQGMPFFVMELVAGVSITDYCDQHRLSLNQRLELFIPICQAVQHAHQKGIIHRDLKPSNVLVAEVDGKAVPKVIDFGVAKATEQSLTDQSYGDTGAIVGTPTYMSPEQADPATTDIDTRTDVYALGVILYELLVGSTPIDARQFQRGAILEMLRMVREVDPPRPSTKLSTAEGLPSIAANRDIEPGRLAQLLRGELDWVVMKCLEKQRERRYETANGLARDIQRYLADEPVEARPPSTSYRVSKFLRKHRGPVIAASVVVLALVGGIIGTTLGLLEAQRQEGLALQARDAETKRAEAENRERVRAEKAEAETKKRADELQQVVDFQAKLFEGVDVALTGVRLRNQLLENVKETGEKAKLTPDEMKARLAAVERAVAGADFAGMALKTLEQNIFVPALETVEKQFGDQPLVKARLLQTLAQTVRELGLLDLAMAPQKSAMETRRTELGARHPDTLASIRSMSSLLRIRGDNSSKAYSLLEEALQGFRTELGNEHPETLHCLTLMGGLLQAQGRLLEAEKYLKEAFEGLRRTLGDAHPDSLKPMKPLGMLLTQLGKFDEAEKMLLESYRRHVKEFGPDEIVTLGVANNLGALYVAMNHLDDAERYYQIAFEGQHRVLGDLHYATITSIDNLGGLYFRKGQMEKAMDYATQALKSRQLLFGENHLTTLRSVHNVAVLQMNRKEYAQAEASLRQALDGFRKQLGPDRPDTLSVAFNLARALKAQKRFVEAEELMRMVMTKRKIVMGVNNRTTIDATMGLADLLDQMQRETDSLKLLIETEKAARAAYTGSQRKSLGSYLSRLGDGYFRAGQFKESETALKEAYSLLQEGFGAQAEETRICTDRLIQLYTKTNNPNELKKWQFEKEKLPKATEKK